MDNKMITLIITLAVGVIMAGALLAPVVSDYGQAQYTITNEGMPFAAADEDTHTITVNAEGAITVDGETIDLALFPGTFNQYTIVYSDSAFVRYNLSNVTVETRYSGSAGVSYDWEDGVTITINGTSATVSNDTTSASKTISDVTYYIATEGDYVMAKNPIVRADDLMYGAGQTYFGGSAGLPTGVNVYTTWKGSVDDGITNTLLYVSGGTYTGVAGDPVINTTEVVDGVYKIDSVKLPFTLSTDSKDYTVTATYTYFLAPATFNYDNPNYLGVGPAAILGGVIVVFLAALVLMASRAAERDD